MDSSRDILRKYASSKSNYFNIADGEEVTVKYLGAEVVPSNFDSGKSEIARYSVEVDGIVKFWDRTSRKLAELMSKYNEGDILIIKRTGEKSQTRYQIRKED